MWTVETYKIKIVSAQMATNCKSVQSTKELNQRLKRISDDLQDVHSKLNTVVAQQRRLDLPSFHHRGGINSQQSFKRKRMMTQQNSLTIPSPHSPQLKSAAIAVNTISNNLKQSSCESEDDGSTGEIDDDDSVKPKLASSVVSTNRILRTREDLIGLVSDEPLNSSNNNLHQGSNRQLEIRNRRMLSFVMSTLNEFKQHNDTYADQSVRRCQEVEDRRRRQAEEDNIRLQRERQMLVEKKRSFLDEQRAVIAELERAEQIQYWNRNGSFLENSIRTDSEPSIFWRPALLEAKAKRKLDDSTLKVRHWIQLKLKGLESPNYNSKELEKMNRTANDNDATKNLIRPESDLTRCTSSSIEINEVEIAHPIIEDLIVANEENDQTDN
ncbi:hypothetical protein GJ496_010729 [Pomphorhynchus laevis]|nr:hypothetical protein GJ496_010729 [Pomphorhynchus laevis]